ncbi:hypothetical protein HAV22_27955 [Massilia sp. TW-1]|uniref:ATP-binding protein n=1 Tax=Telluria antibiotica TaxID=2717319 RepID=A0ABX0PK65_9BURK|nr:hypothetical protein [Telluria antibiotica]NIA57465.1 hypothetical protein [Telluria antibiotica]
MNQELIERKLWYETDRRITLTEGELRRRAEPLVILGEAGMGKSSLLQWLANSDEFALCTARQLINRRNPATLLGTARVLVIDALDEVSAQKDGEAVDLVLQRLGELDYPQFVLSCRVADWRSATGLEAIREQYDQQPLELHLLPFTDEDAIAFLGGRFGIEMARDVVAHFNGRGLQGLLGNPQTLELVARVAGKGDLPETRGDLFHSAIEVLRLEHRDAKICNQPAREAGLDAAGAAFAALIVTGSETIVRTAAINGTTAELQLAEIEQLPGGANVRSMLDTRLFKADRADRFTYWHRSIGEFLGAYWLSKLANTRKKRARLLSLFHSQRLVPASLRGIHAWLALDPALAPAVIAADPMGVIEYGDADSLGIQNARLLLNALKDLATSNPRFRDWRPYSVKSLVQPGLIDDLRELILSRDAPFGLRLLVIESAKGSTVALSLANELRTLALDPDMEFAIRSASGEALVEVDGSSNWQATMRSLCSLNDKLSVRLAIELIDEIGYAPFDDSLIVSLVVAYALQNSRTVGALYRLKVSLPIARLDSLLDCYTNALKKVGDLHDHHADAELLDFAYHLICRRVADGDVNVFEVWKWLESFEGFAGYDLGARAQLTTHIQHDSAVRLALQRYVLLESSAQQSVHLQLHRLSRTLTSFTPSPEDVVELFKALDPGDHSDERWREVVQLVRHDGDIGAEVREAARPFARHRPDLLRWLDRLGTPRPPRWQIKHDRRQEKRRRREVWHRAQSQRDFMGKIEKIRSGDFASIVNLALAYLDYFRDIGSEDVPAHARIETWVGPEVNEAARIGFESFLLHEPAISLAADIVEGLMEGNQHNAAYIVVVALAERRRLGLEVDDVTDERLLACLFELRRSKIDNHAGIDGLEEWVEERVRARGLWTQAMRRYHEPQLRAGRTPVDGLYALMRDPSVAQISADLAADWLMGFDNLPVEPETELVDRLLRSGRYDVLRSVACAKERFVSDTQRHNWDAVGLITDFDATAARLDGQEIEPDLLWHMRDRASGGHRDHGPALTTAQLEWLISTFRGRWPFVGRQSGVTTGDTNSWDATEYITSLISRLGNNPSAESSAALTRLASASIDGYTETIKAVAAEQERIRVESAYVAPTLAALNAFARDAQPASASDLQAYMINELEVVQAKIRSDDAESWRGFFDDKGVPYDEERCRDHLLGLLRQGSDEVTLEPETHVASDKEVDITCSAGTLRMPIEIKGQWHKDLWRAADKQLTALYTRDWRAEDRGTYLVLWFGPNVPSNKELYRSPQGVAKPQTPEQLRDLLIAGSNAARDGLVKCPVPFDHKRV